MFTSRVLFWLSLEIRSPDISVIFKSGSDDIAQAGLELSVLLLQSPGCQDYRRAPPHWARSSNSYIKAD